MKNLERNCKIISEILTFIMFEIVWVSIFERAIDLAGFSKYVPDFIPALLASFIFFKKIRALFAQAVKISYLYYALDRHIKCTKI
ncbi:MULTISPECIES: hypothetical protein [Acinetobacter]|jgi:hypothetical protein|uniref:Uncharacterized protein n=1 Tax=Acinetobacter pittii TaxID=48296 RepID=A0A242U644_ACIPI|nr:MULTISPECIES: hypothetical protein [Acinetobacter]EXS22872.1 hypothetical protein J658_2358 [Acinetobacter baumannii 573719]MBJ8470512.1 hypothetical protein [Acinetobacter pittii]MBJ8501307.1 hypothetical protein [Acinetobacter pittii]MBJ9891522.1 hypothetical protein [Acinetobacter pittii]MCU4478284.1 hypothetical protein [Acinetobacter sp. WU_MDCI_Abxd143]